MLLQLLIGSLFFPMPAFTLNKQKFATEMCDKPENLENAHENAQQPPRVRRASAKRALEQIQEIHAWERCSEKSKRFAIVAASIENQFKQEASSGLLDDADYESVNEEEEDEEESSEGSYESSFVEKSSDEESENESNCDSAEASAEDEFEEDNEVEESTIASDQRDDQSEKKKTVDQIDQTSPKIDPAVVDFLCP